jgi:hypothetical protein
LEDIAGDLDNFNVTIYSTLGTVAISVARGFSIEPGDDIGIQGFDKVVYLYSTVYIYLFLSASLVLIILTYIFILGKKSKKRVTYVLARARFVVGITLLATIHAPFTNEASNSNTTLIYPR